MAFHYVEVEIVPEDDGEGLIKEYAKLAKIHAETGDEAEHGHTIVCQLFACKDSDRKFFLSGRVLDKAESLAFSEILGAPMKKVKRHNV